MGTERVLFLGDGEPNEIQIELLGYLRTELGSDSLVYSLCRPEALSAIDPSELLLIVVGLEHSANADLLNRVLCQELASWDVPIVVFACKPAGTEVLRWLQLGVAAVELWPTPPSRIAFVIDYLTIGKRALARSRSGTTKESRQHSDVATTVPLPEIVSKSAAMKKVIDRVLRIAPQEVSVLLGGETGVGKTVLARALHEHSTRHELPFLVVNCGAIPSTLIESELFGHRRGAFTGADADRKGRFEEVGEGTLFLDEVDSLPLDCQCKLLHVLENRVFEALGSNQPLRFRGRIVAATNACLETLIEKGEFRADLYYRLGVVEIYVPPLRERKEDILPIAEATLRTYAENRSVPFRPLCPDVIELLESFPWPGNVRQLKNVVGSAAAMCDWGAIGLAELPDRWLKSATAYCRERHQADPQSVGVGDAPIDNPITYLHGGSPSLPQSREQYETERIKEVLLAVGNNRSKAARELGISRSMLYKKLAKYHLT